MTAELALALPAVMLMLAVGVGAARVVSAQIQCVDAARAAARIAARGEPESNAVAAAVSAGPPAARVAYGAADDTVTVTVSAVVRLPLPGGPTVPVSSTARGPRELTAES